MTRQHIKSTGTFHFKQFSIKDDRSTMKVGTDAVLLGAVAAIRQAGSILEIGTGSGVIALMLAQRSGAFIDAIEIDGDSVRQARENAAQSPWKDRINIIQASLQEFTGKAGRKYDLVITNPPFFSRSLKSGNPLRNISRHDEALDFNELIRGSTALMKEKASFWLILPVNESSEFLTIAGKSGLSVHFSMQIFPKTGKPAHRFIFELRKAEAKAIIHKELYIWDKDGNKSKDHAALTGDFYLDL